jgi:hypothetical protein
MCKPMPKLGYPAWSPQKFTFLAYYNLPTRPIQTVVLQLFMYLIGKIKIIDGPKGAV